MNREVKDKWVVALKSGEYKQGKYFLNGATGYCCLGVLCDLAVKEGIGTWEDHERVGAKSYVSGESINTYALTPEVMEWAGLDSPTPLVTIKKSDKVAVPISIANDSTVSFTRIAKIIEKQL